MQHPGRLSMQGSHAICIPVGPLDALPDNVAGQWRDLGALEADRCCPERQQQGA